MIGRVGYYTLTWGFRRCSFRLIAMREPSERGTSDNVAPRFFCLYKSTFEKQNSYRARELTKQYCMANQNGITSNALQNLPSAIQEVLKAKFSELMSYFPEENQKEVLNKTDNLTKATTNEIVEKAEAPMLQKKLDTLYEHEKHYLEILKEYKEEIKFASSLQADIRKEEAAFFSSTLKDVCNSLKETQISKEYQSQWIYDLVTSYTSSLKLSSKLAEEHVINLLGEIQKEATKIVKES